MRASKAMQHRVNSKKNIDLRYNTEVVEVLGDNVVEGIKVVNNKTSETEVIDITGFFVAIGHKPNTDIFKGQLDMDDTGYILTEVRQQKQIFLVFLPLVMCKIRITDRQLQLLVQDVWQRWMPKDTWLP